MSSLSLLLLSLPKTKGETKEGIHFEKVFWRARARARLHLLELRGELRVRGVDVRSLLALALELVGHLLELLRLVLLGVREGREGGAAR